MIVLLIAAGYVVVSLLAARRRYQKIRPYTEPVNCDRPHYCASGLHTPACFTRVSGVDTEGRAFAYALLPSLLWPVILPALLVRRFVMTGGRPLPEEVQAQIKRLEAENERLKRQQETA